MREFYECLLCHSDTETLLEDYRRCLTCDLRFLLPEKRLSAEEEKARYEEHNNDIYDPRYQSFLMPVHDRIKSSFASGNTGLDFGAGTGPALSMLLQKSGFAMSLYDPFFHPDVSVLSRQYDFIVATEVVEHLHSPETEFKRLRHLIKPSGKLVLMTLIYDESIDFKSWYYRRDPTHVLFYSKKTFDWIGRNFEFKSVEVFGERLVTLTAY